MKWVLKGKKKVWEGKFVEVWVKKFITPKGKKIVWECTELKSEKSDVFTVIPLTSKREIILVKQFRGTIEKYIIEFPAGRREKNESLEKAAKRELIEETGYQAGKMIQLFPSGPFAPGTMKNVLTYFLATNLKFVGRHGGDVAEEDLKVLKIPLFQTEKFLKQQIQKGIEVDVKIWSMIFFIKFGV